MTYFFHFVIFNVFSFSILRCHFSFVRCGGVFARAFLFLFSSSPYVFQKQKTKNNKRAFIVIVFCFFLFFFFPIRLCQRLIFYSHFPLSLSFFVFGFLKKTINNARASSVFLYLRTRARRARVFFFLFLSLSVRANNFYTFPPPSPKTVLPFSLRLRPGFIILFSIGNKQMQMKVCLLIMYPLFF